ncbi:MAG: dodecin family protein [Verrucomicrobia bacterium]|nr:dodecin family protein [Verrucomicrobiota bacterium]
MKDHIYRHLELTGTSAKSIEDAVANAIKHAHQTIRKLAWFQVLETRGAIDKGRILQWQVTIKVGFTAED